MLWEASSFEGRRAFSGAPSSRGSKRICVHMIPSTRVRSFARVFFIVGGRPKLKFDENYLSNIKIHTRLCSTRPEKLPFEKMKGSRVQW
jgi:hypothetical protein